MKLLQQILLLITVLIGSLTDNPDNSTIPKHSIPFEFINDIIYVKVDIGNSKNMNFVFDTGAGATVISKSVGEKLNLKNGYSIYNTGAAGSRTQAFYPGQTITIGDVVLKNVGVMKYDAEIKDMVLGRKMDGIIGYDLLSKFIVKIDYQNRKIDLWKNGTYSFPQKAEKIPFSIMSNIPLINTSFKIGVNNYAGPFLIDSGAKAHLLLNAPFVRKNKILDDVTKKYSITTNLGITNTSSTLTVVRIEEFRLGNHSFKQVPTVLSQAEQGVLSLPSIHGIIGNSILKQFNITFDYQNETMYLERTSSPNPFFPVECLGAVFVKDFSDRKVLIKSIIENSPADIGGLKAGDRLIAIDNESLETISSERMEEILKMEGKTIEIKILREKFKLTKHIKLKALI